MKVNFRLYRTITIPTNHLKGTVGLEADAGNELAARRIQESFGPHMAPGFRIFWPQEPGYRKTVVGIEAMSFDLTDPNVAQAGFIQADPIDPVVVHRLDGALQSELRRFGIYLTKAEDHEWRATYEVRGGTMPGSLPDPAVLPDDEEA